MMFEGDVMAMMAETGPIGFDLPSTSSLIRGWDFGVASGSNVSSVAAAYGTSQNLSLTGTSGTADALATFSPNAQNMLDTTASNNEVGTFTSTGALSTFTVAFVFAPKDAAASVPIIGGPSAAYIQLDATSGRFYRIAWRTNTSSAGVVNFTAPQYMWPGGCYVVVFTWDGTNAVVRVNGVSATSTRSGAATFDRLFRQSTASVYGSGMWGALAIWNDVLDASEIASLEAMWAGYKAGRIYLSNSTGDDTTGYGFSQASPRKTLAAAFTYGGIAQRTGIALKRGDEWNEAVTTSFGQSGASASDRFVFDVWGSGSAMARLWGTAKSSGWVDAGGGLWTKSGVTVQPGDIWKINDPADVTTAGVTKLSYAATSTDYTFQWDDPTDTITARFASGVDPNVADIRIAPASTQKGFDSAQNNLSIRDVSFRFWSGVGSRPTGTNVEFLRTEHSWNVDDGANGNGTAITYQDGWVIGNGPAVPSSGQGDGVSFHGGATGTVSNMRIEANSLGGMRNEQYTSVTVTNSYLSGNGYDIIILAQGTGSAPVTTLVTNNEVYVTTASVTGYAVELSTGLVAGVGLTATGNSFTSVGSTRPKAVNAAGGTFTDGGGNALTGFTSLQ